MDLLNEIVSEVQGVLSQVDRDELQEIMGLFVKENSIFIDGEGRSGLMAKGFAMRLMHLGYDVFVIGETITPAIRENDLLVIASGSGSSPGLLASAEKAKKSGARTLLVSSKRDSLIAKVVDCAFVVPGTVKGEQGVNRGSIQLLSTLFDQSLHLVLDALCLMISQRDEMSNDEATQLHW